MIQYESAYDYLSVSANDTDRIAKLDVLIDALYEAATRAATTGNINSYLIDNGQTRINTEYRSIDAIKKDIEGLEKLKEMYVVRYNNTRNGRMTRLVDEKNFR